MARGSPAGHWAPDHVIAARNAVALSFFLNGFAFASLFSRIPSMRDRLDLTNSGLGLLLLCLSAASVAGLPTSGPLTARFGPVRIVRWGTTAVGIGLFGMAMALRAGSVPMAAVSLAAYGLGTALWDVAMNVEGADVERMLGRTIMPRFHAAFSLGSVTGAGVGALTVRAAWAPTTHLLVVLVPVMTASYLAAGRFAESATGAEPGPSGAARAWLEPRTLLIGVMVFALALTEGVANDWPALALRDGYQAAEWLAVLGFALFVASMTTGRMVGPILLDRFGRVSVLWGTMAGAFVGVLLVVWAGPGPMLVLGIVMWGLGASLGFPVGMSAAADDPDAAAARVSVVSTIGYGAFLAGPPLLGFLGDHVGILKALLVVGVLLIPAALVVPSARPLKQ